MDRKGATLSIETIVITILAVLALVILIVAFRSQITSLFDSFKHLITGTSDQLSQVKISEVVK